LVKRTHLILVLVLVLVAVVVFFAVRPRPEERFLSIATGGVAGVYYPLGGALAEIINEKVSGVTATAETTGASVANVRMLAEGSVELALVQNDIAFYALNGREMFTEPVTALRGVATLYPEVIQLVTLEGSGINTLGDLRGKRVAVGAPGSGTEANARQILATQGITYADLTVDYLSFAEAAGSLKDGHIDAAFLTAGIPTAAVMDIAATHPVKLVPLGSDVYNLLVTDYPFYARVTIPAGTYRGQDAQLESVAVMAMLVVSAELPENLVYNVTKAMFENLDRLGAAHARGKDIKLEKATEGLPIPLHPGTERYFREKGVGF